MKSFPFKVFPRKIISDAQRTAERYENKRKLKLLNNVESERGKTSRRGKTFSLSLFAVFIPKEMINLRHGRQRGRDARAVLGTLTQRVNDKVKLAEFDFFLRIHQTKSQ